MPPRSGQLDEISQALGRLEGQFGGIEKYMHEREHGINNLMQKVEALGTRITRDIAAVEGRIEGRIKAMDDRLVMLERARERDTGAKNMALTVLHSPVVAWVFAMVVIAWNYFKGPTR